MILDFDSKIKDFFGYVQTANEGERLIVKIKSQASEAEIYESYIVVTER
jgi:type I restriction enzyme R subunit